jgi:large subunit ribosomal protein L3
MAAIIGKKLGMTQIFREDGTRVPVTVIEAGPCPVTAVRDPERDGYAAVQLGFGEVDEHKLTKGELGHLRKAGAPALRALVEFRDEDLGADDGPKVGETARVDQFEAGQRVKVSGVAIGKGFGRRVTQRRLEVVDVDPERNLLLVRGAVPGPKNGTVEVRSDG